MRATPRGYGPEFIARLRVRLARGAFMTQPTLANFCRTDDLESANQRLAAAARDKWADDAAAGRRWTFWMRLTWAWPVSESTALRHVERWANRLTRRIPESAVLVGIHGDTDRRHAHALVYLPRGNAGPNSRPWEWLRGCATTWHQRRWSHGLIWLDRYSPRSAETREHHASAEYLAKGDAVGTVMKFGTAPSYSPRRKPRAARHRR